MIAANPQTTPHGSGSPPRDAGWSSIHGTNRGVFALLGAVAIYLLFAFAWSATGRRDTEFARSAALAGACGAGAALIIAIQALFAERPSHSARQGWTSLAIACAAMLASAMASFYAVWSDGAVFWRPAAIEWLETGSALALLAGVVLLCSLQPIDRELLGKLVALVLTALVLWTLVLIGIQGWATNAETKWSLLAPVFRAALSSSGLIVALMTLRSADRDLIGRALGLAIIAAGWTATPLLHDVGEWARAPGVIGLAMWLFPIASLGLAAAALSQRHLATGSIEDRTEFVLSERISTSRAQLFGTAVLIGAALVALASGASVTADLVVIASVAVFLQLARLAFDLMVERERVEALLDSAEQLERLANIDLLTQLPNRAALNSRLAEEMERAVRYEQPLSVCFIDIDHFKSVNDRYGHFAGDLVLREVATSLEQTARSIDFVGRFGGEEFVVIAPGTWSEDARVLGERLRTQVEKLVLAGIDTEPFEITISIGIAGFPEHAESLQLIMERADEALYRSKEYGRNRVTLWHFGVDE